MSNAVADKIVKAVSDVTGLSVVAIMGRGRYGSVARARILSMGLVRDNTMMSLEETGDFFHRDHTTVLTGHRRFETLMDSDATFRATYNAVANSLNGTIIVRRDTPPGSPDAPLPPAAPQPSEVICAVADAAELTLDEMMGTDRAPEIVRAKRIAIVLLRELTPLSFTEIARSLCIPNHSTVITSLKQHGTAPDRWGAAIEEKARAALASLPQK